MKILIYSDLRKISHSVKPESEIFVQMAKLAHSVTVFSPDFDDDSYFTDAGITTYRTGQTKKICLKTIKMLRAELRSQHYDIIYATNSKSIPSCAFAAIGFNTKLVCYRGTTRGLKRSDPTSYLTLLHPRVNAVICVSDAVKQSVQKKLLKNKNSVVSIFKGHKLAWYTATPVDLTTLGIPNNAFVAIAVARFRPTKGLSVLIEAAGLLADLPQFHLLIVGSGTEPYAEAIQASPIQSRIHVTGHRHDAPQLIAASQVLVQASTDGEGLPRSILEGLAYGKPAISTTAGGAKEILDEGQTGFIVPTHNAKAIADKIRYLYNNADTLPNMAKQCKTAIAGKLSNDVTTEQYLAFFKQLTQAL